MPEVEELTEGDPRELVIENARRKAAAVEGELVLGADTVVAVDGRDPGQARQTRPRLGTTSLAFRRARTRCGAAWPR